MDKHWRTASVKGLSCLKNLILVTICATQVSGHYVMAHAGTIADLEKQVIGAWRLVRTQQRLEDGSVRPKPAYGSRGTGYLIYDSSHTMCVFLANPDAPPKALGQPRGEPGSSMDSPAAYCGKWYIDPDGPQIVHRTELDVFPESLGQERRRKFSREGDILFLRPTITTPGVIDYYLQFERVRED